MKDTIIVFAGIGIVALLPLLLYGLKCIWMAARGNKITYFPSRLLGVLIAMVVLMVFVIRLYSFTSGSQAPLVAERFHSIFRQRAIQEIDVEEYSKELEKAGLITGDFVFHQNTELEQAGFKPSDYSIFLSENTYNNEDGSITLYARYESGDKNIFTSLRLKKENNQWKAIEHQIISDEDGESPELKKRFFPLQIGE